MKKLLPVSLLLLAGLSGCVMYGRAGGPAGQPYDVGTAVPPQPQPQPPQPHYVPSPPYGGQSQ